MQQKSLLTYWGESFTKHYADFSGRARRSEYWGTVLFNVLIQAVLTIILSFVVYYLVFLHRNKWGGYLLSFILFAT